VAGFSVGHAQAPAGRTGCTVVLCPPGTVGGMEARGSATGTRQTDGLLPGHMVNEIHAVLLTGGSAFGVGPAVTARLGLKGLDLPDFLQRFDFCLGVGLAIMIGAATPLGVLSHLGFDYFLSDKIAIRLEGTYFGSYGGGAAGALFKL